MASPGVAAAKHDISQPFEHRRGHSQDRQLILHQQDGLVTAFHWQVPPLLRQERCFCRVPGQIDLEGRPLARLAVDIDEAIVLLDHAVNRCQPQAGAFAHFLGGEERLEQMAQSLLVHAAAVVADRQQHVLARHKPGVIGAIGFVKRDDIRLDGDLCPRPRWRPGR